MTLHFKFISIVFSFLKVLGLYFWHADFLIQLIQFVSTINKKEGGITYQGPLLWVRAARRVTWKKGEFYDHLRGVEPAALADGRGEAGKQLPSPSNPMADCWGAGERRSLQAKGLAAILCLQRPRSFLPIPPFVYNGSNGGFKHC